MRKLIILGLMAATIAPATAASAQSAAEVRHSQRELREEQRELRDAYRYGDRRDVRDERRDVRQAQRELRDDVRDRREWQRDNWRRNEWQDYRRGHRNLYARGNWRAPYRYQAFRPGVRIARSYYAPRTFIADPWRYRLPSAPRYARWVRHYDDVLLVDTRRGIVLDVVRGFYW